MNENPLKQYFRKPSIHLDLPSHGKFYPVGTIAMPETGEVPVFPMTALDEINYKTPDALFNGSAIVDVIKSCIPAISNPWEMPAIDLNVILASIRIASIGEEIEVESTCPHCENSENYTFDLHKIIDDSPDVAEYEKPLNIGDLQVFFKPLSYKTLNENNKGQFEEQKLAQLLSDNDMEDDKKLTLLSDAFKRIAKLSVNTIGKSIRFIKTPDISVEEPEHISEFLSNCETDVYDAIKNRIVELKELEEIKPLHIKCPECEGEYDQEFILDMTTFFDRNS